jgi:hypothetical protein
VFLCHLCPYFLPFLCPLCSSPCGIFSLGPWVLVLMILWPVFLCPMCPYFLPFLCPLCSSPCDLFSLGPWVLVLMILWPVFLCPYFFPFSVVSSSPIWYILLVSLCSFFSIPFSLSLSCIFIFLLCVVVSSLFLYSYICVARISHVSLSLYAAVPLCLPIKTLCSVISPMSLVF